MKKCIVVLLILAAALTSGCGNNAKGNHFRGAERFTVVEEVGHEDASITPILIVVDNKTGYEYFASNVRGDYAIGGAVLGEDGKPVKIK